MKRFGNLLKLFAGIGTGYSLSFFTWMFWQLSKADPRFTLLVPQNTAAKGLSSVQGKTTPKYTLQHVIEDGIERITYIPKDQHFETPIFMVHGMWHGAWCWEPWQKQLAEWGWESHAISLPGHGESPVQRPIRKCTLDYYLGFIRDEVNKLSCKPILLGHSMGGALTQWYLKYIGDNLPAAVFPASWVSHSIVQDGGWLMLKQDPGMYPLTMLTWDASSWIRNPHKAAEKLLGPQAKISPQDLYDRLGPESMLVAYQHSPPIWQPPENVRTPSLWLAGELDAVATVAGLQKSAHHYGGDFVIIPGAGHNLMMEHNEAETVKTIHNWLVTQEIS